MSAKPSPSIPTAHAHARNRVRFVCACRWLTTSAHEVPLGFASVPYFPAQTRTYDGDRACLQPRIAAERTEQPIPFRSSGPHSLPRWQVSQAPMRCNYPAALKLSPVSLPGPAARRPSAVPPAQPKEKIGFRQLFENNTVRFPVKIYRPSERLVCYRCRRAAETTDLDRIAEGRG